MRILVLLLLSCLQVQAIDLKVARGRFSLVDLGSLIISEPLVLNPSLVNVYPLSGLKNENSTSVIAIQGLRDKGSTDLTIDTEAGIYQLHLNLNKTNGDDLFLGQARRSKVIESVITLKQSRSSIVATPDYINRYILAANPSLIDYRNIKNYYHQDFLKVFALATNNKEGLTDIVVPSQAGVYKFTVSIKGEADENHTNFIDLGLLTSSGY